MTSKRRAAKELSGYLGRLRGWRLGLSLAVIVGVLLVALIGLPAHG